MMKSRRYLVSMLIFLMCSNLYAATETLRMHIWEGYFPEKHRKEFAAKIKEKHGIDLKYKITYVSEAKEFFNGIRTKKYDLITPTHNLLKDERFGFIGKGLLLPINLDHVPNAKDLIPGLSSASYRSEKGKIYAMPYAHGPYGLAYNTDKFKESPKSWKVLIDPSFKGKYSIVEDYAEVNVYVAALIEGISPQVLGFPEKVNTPKVLKTLKTLKQNSGSMWRGVDKAKDLQDKQLATSWGFSFSDLKKKNQDWAFAEPQEGTPWWVDNIALSATLKGQAKKKQIAEELINYLISPEVQADNVIKNLSAQPINIKTPLSQKQKVKFRMSEDAASFVKTRILWPTLTKRARNTYSVMWKKASQ